MRIDGTTKVCGVIGNPIAHTMSPQIHNFLAEKMGIHMAYLPFLVEKEGLSDAIKGAYALDVLGLNVTIPFKSDVLPLLCGVDDLAAQIGAVNTLVRKDEGFYGYNTDMPGLYRAMCSDGISLEGEKVLILGAGGAARAVAMMLAQKGVSEIRMLNRTLEKARAIASEIEGAIGKKIVIPMELGAYRELPEGEKFIAIQATNVGMHPNEGVAILSEKDFYDHVKVGYDLVYNPLETRFMQLVRESGGKAYHGLKMLLYQGIIAFELWTGTQVPEEIANETYAVVLDLMQKKEKQ